VAEEAGATQRQTAVFRRGVLFVTLVVSVDGINFENEIRIRKGKKEEKANRQTSMA
jgi:hypothetical protein